MLRVRNSVEVPRVLLFLLLLGLSVQTTYGQCPAVASATVQDGTVTLTMATSGTCGVGAVLWELDQAGGYDGVQCPNGAPSCTIVKTFDNCMADGTHVFH